MMSFGLSNSLSTFMQLMNQIFWPLLYKFMVIYFDDILIYSYTLEAHIQYLQVLFEVLREQHLYANQNKC